MIVRSSILATLLLSVAARGATPDARSLLMRGNVGQATIVLQQQIAANPSDGQAHLLLCRVELAQEHTDAAIAECEQATSLLPASSEAQDWLGRALGQKASHASAFSAMGYARRVHTAFERAVQLNPSSPAATSDLGEYYIAAPGIVGGGTDKAQPLIKSMLTFAPARAHRLLALLAEKNKDLPAAEAEYKKAIEVSHTAQSILDLALFYQRHKRPDDAALAVTLAFAAEPQHGPVEVDLASLLTDLHRTPDVAIAALRAYLASPNQTDEAPTFKAHLQLGRLLLARGDRAGAKAEYMAAVTLAPAYEPARKALASL